MRKLSGWLLVIVVVWPGPLRGEGLDDSLKHLALGLAQDINKAGLKRVAVPEFANAQGTLGGETGAAGRYVAEKLEEYLVSAPGRTYEVIERRQFSRGIKGIRVSVTEILGKENCSTLMDRFKGLDGLILGRLTRKGTTVSIACKAVHLPDGEIKGTKAIEARLDADLMILFGENVSAVTPQPAGLLTLENVIQTVIKPSPETPVPQLDSGCPFRLEVLVKDQPKPLYQKGRQVFVPVKEGERFQMRLTNLSPHTVAVVLSVDGLNSITQTREVGNRSAKWILKGKTMTIISGWQKDDGTAREFVIVGSDESLAARTRFTDQIGLITAAFYPEKGAKVRPYEGSRGVGTGEGQVIAAPVKRVDFQHEAVPAAILTLHYDAAAVVEKYERVGY